jgi:Arc/MetJ family transcription regulator
MRLSMNVDDELLRKAQELTGLTRKSAILRAGLTALIERESARKLAQLGGTEPALRPTARRRSQAK